MNVPGKENAAISCLCEQFDHFREHVQWSMGSNVTELVDHMDSCSNWLRAAKHVAAVAPQRDWAVHLFEKCSVQKSSGLVRGLLNNNQWTAVLALCPAGPVRDSLKALLLLACIRYSLGPLAVHILQREGVSDSQLMEAVLFAAHLQDRCTFLQLIRASPRSVRVFKQKFVHQFSMENLQSVREGGEGGRWMYRTLYEGMEKDLALFVAASHPHENALIVEFCQDDIDHFDLKQDKFRFALRKLYDYNVNSYHEFVERLYRSPGRSEFDRSFLFRQAIQWKEYGFVMTLCKLGVVHKDLKFCAARLLSGDGADSDTFSDICENLGQEDRQWLSLYAAEFTMKQYFRLKSDASLEAFIEQIPHHESDDASPVLKYLFRKAIEKCLKLNCADCFIQLCMKYCGDGLQVEKKSWDVLYWFLSDIKDCVGKGFDLLEKCVHHMLSDQSTWPGLAPVLDQWLKKNSMEHTKSEVYLVQEKLAKGDWPFSMSSLKQWCLDNGHPTLAFFLAVVTGDWELVQTVVGTLSTLELHPEFLWTAVELVTVKGLFYLGVDMLKIYPLKAEVVRSYKHFKGSECLLSICEAQGLFDWAMVLQCHNLTHLRDHYRRHNHVVLDWILIRLTVPDLYGSRYRSSSRRWTILRELMTRCSDSEILRRVLKNLVKCSGPEDIVEALMSRVDPVACVDVDADHEDTNKDEKESLLYEAVYYLFFRYGFRNKCSTTIKIIRLLLASGLSTFERDHFPGGEPGCLLSTILDSISEFAHRHLKAVKWMLECGTFCYKTLSEVTNDRELTDTDTVSEEWTEAFRLVQEAAATPCRLEHLARLAVSHSIGCQPGRADRINSLPIPPALKDKVNFKDVLKEEDTEQDEETTDEEDYDNDSEENEDEIDVEDIEEDEDYIVWDEDGEEDDDESDEEDGEVDRDDDDSEEDEDEIDVEDIEEDEDYIVWDEDGEEDEDKGDEEDGEVDREEH